MAELTPSGLPGIWPQPWPAPPDGRPIWSTRNPVPLADITGSVQGEIRSAFVDGKVDQIRGILESGRGELPSVRLAPHNGGWAVIDGNHTLEAYRQLGFTQIPGQTYTPAGVQDYLIPQGAFDPNRVFPIGEMRTVDAFSGSPREQFERRQQEGQGGQGCTGCTPPPPDAAQAFQRAQQAGGSTADGVVYGVGGTPDNPQVYRFTPSGQYLGTADMSRLPTSVEFGVTDQVLRMQNPTSALRRVVSAPDGQRYTLGPGGIHVDDGGTFRALSAAERAALPRTVQTQLMMRAAGPALAMPDGVNGMGRRIGSEVLGNWMDGVDLNMQADQRFGPDWRSGGSGGVPSGGALPRTVPRSGTGR